MLRGYGPQGEASPHEHLLSITPLLPGWLKGLLIVILKRPDSCGRGVTGSILKILKLGSLFFLFFPLERPS